ncbi:MAG: HemK/PrmC family methyltransferase, partial [Candidatus Komeilibacteria bacterium]|nr:HemK/PrmC family methyltransferase [Candidatus Komeilibacteria bacterium]
MTLIRNLLQSGYNKLKHLKTALLDSEVLLSFVLQKPRAYILAHPEDEVPNDKVEQFNNLIARRAAHEPVAYLINQKEFYNQNFYVDKRVHIPRPSTEDLIDCIKKIIPPDFIGTIADIGTGSGCIAVTLALEYPRAKIIATDISDEALKVVRQNARDLGANKIEFLCGDLLSPLPGPIDVIVSNPPYGWPARSGSARAGEPQDWSDDPEIFFQPKISYESGTDGLAAIS